MKKPTILVTNDDGITAPGIRVLIKVMRQLGEVVVVAPDSPRSGQGHAITVAEPLRVKLIAEEDDYREYSCNGTPVDCVKLGTQIVLRRKPDLLVSGINHGSNASINVVYSGTMAAVLEAAIDKIPAIGYSLNDYSAKAVFSHTEEYVKQIAADVLENGLPDGVCLNVNFPKIREEEKMQGIKVCRQAMGSWVEEFDERTDPRGRNYYWITGVFSNPDHKEGTDTWALEHNYAAVVPMKFDFTHHEAIEKVRSMSFADKSKADPVPGNNQPEHSIVFNSMIFLQKALKKNSYAFGAFLAVIAPVVFLFLIHFLFGFFSGLANVRPYGIDKFYLLSISINLLLMRYYLVNAKFVKTGKSILAVTFILMILFFVFE